MFSWLLSFVVSCLLKATVREDIRPTCPARLSTRTNVTAILRLCHGIASLILSLMLSPTRGFVFRTIHNIQANTLLEMVLAMFEVVRA